MKFVININSWRLITSFSFFCVCWGTLALPFWPQCFLFRLRFAWLFIGFLRLPFFFGLFDLAVVLLLVSWAKEQHLSKQTRPANTDTTTHRYVRMWRARTRHSKPLARAHIASSLYVSLPAVPSKLSTISTSTPSSQPAPTSQLPSSISNWFPASHLHIPPLAPSLWASAATSQKCTQNPQLYLVNNLSASQGSQFLWHPTVLVCYLVCVCVCYTQRNTYRTCFCSQIGEYIIKDVPFFKKACSGIRLRVLLSSLTEWNG